MTYCLTVVPNVKVNANGMAISIEGTDVVPNEFYVNDQGQIINLKGDVLQPVVTLAGIFGVADLKKAKHFAK